MSVAEIHSTATLTPSKDEMCAQFSDIAQRLGSYRASLDALPGEIMTGEKCADYSAGGPLFVVAGSGSLPNSTVTTPDITTYDSTHASGTIHINGERREFSLSFPPINDAATVKDSTLALVATQPDSSFPVSYLTLS